MTKNANEDQSEFARLSHTKLAIDMCNQLRKLGLDYRNAEINEHSAVIVVPRDESQEITLRITLKMDHAYYHVCDGDFKTEQESIEKAIEEYRALVNTRES